jgi:hypothetical protein
MKRPAALKDRHDSQMTAAEILLAITPRRIHGTNFRREPREKRVFTLKTRPLRVSDS